MAEWAAHFKQAYSVAAAPTEDACTLVNSTCNHLIVAPCWPRPRWPITPTCWWIPRGQARGRRGGHRRWAVSETYSAPSSLKHTIRHIASYRLPCGGVLLVISATPTAQSCLHPLPAPTGRWPHLFPHLPACRSASPVRPQVRASSASSVLPNFSQQFPPSGSYEASGGWTCA